MSIKEVSREIREIVGVIRKSAFQELKDGILYFIKNKDIRFTSGVIFILWSALGAVYVVLIVFVQNVLHSASPEQRLPSCKASNEGFSSFWGSEAVSACALLSEC